MLRVWGRKSSSNVQCVLWCLAELGVPHDRVDAGFIYGVVDTQDYLDKNPNGTVPTIQDGDMPPLWESGAILRYLAAKYGSGAFWPADPARRAEVDQWAEWSKLNIALNFTRPIFWQMVRTAPAQRDMAVVANALTVLNGFLDTADRQLSTRQFIAGNDLTFADIQFGHCLYRYFDIDIERATHENVRRYYDGLCERPAYQQTVMEPYDELRAVDSGSKPGA